MPDYSAEVIWLRGAQPFLDNRYSRRHLLRFDGGLEVPGSSSPHVVRPPLSDVAAVDPEEALIASISSCHMLWFLSLAVGRQYCVDRYVDAAIGRMTKNAKGKLWVSQVTLRPLVVFSGDLRPTRAQVDALHHTAHEECFIANSVLTAIDCQPDYGDSIAAD